MTAVSPRGFVGTRAQFDSQEGRIEYRTSEGIRRRMAALRERAQDSRPQDKLNTHIPWQRQRKLSGSLQEFQRSDPKRT